MAERGTGDNRILRLGFAVAFLFAHGYSIGVSSFDAMKTSILHIGLMLLISTGIATQARDPEFLPDATGSTSQSADQRPAASPPFTTSPLQDFANRLEAAIKTKDLSAIMALYRTNGVLAAELAAENSRWQQIILEDADGKVSVYGKELGTLPSEQARKCYSELAQQLTKRPVTHIVMASFGHGIQLVLPLVSLEGRLWIVPSEKKQPRIELGGPANGSHPIRSETNRPSSAAGL
jgi:hypothetical protein